MMPKPVHILPLLLLLLLSGKQDDNLIRTHENRIHNRTPELDSLMTRLKQKREITVLHLGDSHIEMRSFPEAIREAFEANIFPTDQGWFLPAGIFPELYDAKLKVTRQSKPFRTDNARTYDPELRIGLTGRTFALESKENRICISFRDTTSELEILHDNRDDLQIKVFGKQAKKAQLSCQEQTPGLAEIRGTGLCITKITFPPSQKLELRFNKKKKERVHFYAFRTLKKQVHYSNFGLSGGKFEHLFLARDLQAQAQLFQPDLVIVTLGTNDSYQKGLDTTAFRSRLLFLVQQIRLFSPKTAFVFMTAPDTRYKGSKPPHLAFVNRSIREFCQEFKLSYWDWNAVMGGENSIDQWENSPFAYGDYLHFSPESYRMFGLAFGDALLHSERE